MRDILFPLSLIVPYRIELQEFLIYHNFTSLGDGYFSSVYYFAKLCCAGVHGYFSENNNGVTVPMSVIVFV